MSPYPASLVSLLAGVFAQAGGGGSFGGSSGGGGGGGSFGGGGSGGGDGDGGVEVIILLVRFTIHYPQVAIPMWAVVGALFYFGRRKTSDYRITRTIRRGRKLQEEDLRNAAIGQIQQRDPGFDLETFLQRVTNGFVTTQIAWSEQDLRRCRAFISDGVRERFELYIAMQRAENIRNRMKDVTVTGSRIVCVTTDAHFDTIHVRITASAISYNEDLQTGRRVSGNSDRTPIRFTEIWSFSRRPGVRTNPEASLLQGRCPNCGGPVDIVDKAECPQCGSTVNSGQYDWVLAEITQDEEWVVPPPQHAVKGWNDLQQRDSGLNFQHIEDRASVVFWRAMMAVYFADPAYAAPILAADADGLPPVWNRGPQFFWKTPAVGVVEVVQCGPAEDDEFDRILVLVRWSATPARGDRQKPEPLGPQRVYSHVLVLKRHRSVTSQVDGAFASFSCTGCGAPINRGGSDKCGFCGLPLNDGRGDWVLESAGPNQLLQDLAREQRQDEHLMREGGVERLEADRFLNEPGLLTALARMLTVDGELADTEREHITALAKRRGVTDERLQAIFATAASDESPFTLPTEQAHGRIFMEHLLRAALVDGKVTSAERTLLQKAATQIGWSEADLRLALARVRKELYQQARTILRARKRQPPRTPPQS